MLLQRLVTSAVAMEDMAMEAMVAMEATVMERDLLKLKLKLMLSQDTPEDMEDMDMVVMVAMDVDTMARGKLMLSPAMVVMDMVVMAVHMEVMVDMVIAVKFLPLFIIPPPIIDILIGFKTKNMNKT